MSHLWEVEHPYYCSESNYYKSGLANQFASWQDFTETTFHSGDADLNLVFRWDWTRPDPDDYVTGEEIPGDYLQLFFVLQRKGIFCSAQIEVTEADEPAVRAWLAERAKTMAAIWAPLAVSL